MIILLFVCNQVSFLIFTRAHPGGLLPLLACAGKDATAPFLAFHPEYVHKRMRAFHIANLRSDDNYGVNASTDITPEQKAACAKEFREIIKQLEADGFFKTRYSYYFLMIARLALLFGASMWLAVTSNEISWQIVSAVLLGLFWQQAALMGHDLCHNAVTHDRNTDLFISILSSMLLGVSSQWWKRSHNIHHIATNSLEFDPDIQHLPVFAVTEKYFKNVFSRYHGRIMAFDRIAHFLVSYQHLLYYPVMAVAKVNLYIQSWIMLIKTQDKVSFRKLDMFCMTFFAFWYTTLLMSFGTWQRSLLYFAVSCGVSGILHVQITLSHFGMPTYDGKPQTGEDDGYSFILTQLLHSMDVDCPEWFDFFHGGLQFQVMHHLIPRLPRHNLRMATTEYLIPFCKKWNLPYQSFTFYEANTYVLNKLRGVAMSARSLKAPTL